MVVGYTGHSFFLPNWFVRRRGIALGMAFSGVGVGAVLLFPWLQAMIVGAGLAHRLLGDGGCFSSYCLCRSTRSSSVCGPRT